MRHASLFSGIGGFDLAAEWMGWENVFNCEIDKFCQKVLKYHFPDATQYEDIKQTDFTIWRGRVDIITGGFPCQPFSMAGKRRGTDDDRHLWPEMLRTIREIKPRWVVGENVYGFVNWNGGMVFNEVLSDLEGEGYEVQPFIIPACAVNAPHRRDRVWIVAHRKSNGKTKFNGKKIHEKQFQTGADINRFFNNGSAADTELHGHNGNTFEEGQQPGGRWTARCEPSSPCNEQTIADTDINKKCERRLYQDGGKAERQTGTFNARDYERGTWHNFPTQPPLRSRNDGFPGGLDGITVSKLRNESIKAYGNAVVPVLVYEIFQAIQKYEEQINNQL